MADKTLLSQMLEQLVNDNQAKAEELFHEYVVSASREIYENLIESEISEEDDEDEDDKEVEEASEEDEDDEKVEENFDEVAYEGDDEMDLDDSDPTDDLAGEIDPDAEMDGEEKSEEELFQDLDSIVDELQAKFDELKGGDHEEPDMDNMGGPSDHDADNEQFDLATVREYVEKVPAGHGAEKKGAAAGQNVGAETGANSRDGEKNTKSVVAGKNDMGGTTANILSGRNGAEAGGVGAGGTIKGSALSDTKAKEDNAGNINVPGGKAGNAFTTKQPGHGAEKAGSKESADNKQSLFRGRR
jgi:hypothetical protein